MYCRSIRRISNKKNQPLTHMPHETSLSKITKFDPIIKCISSDSKHFSIIVQYYTKNGGRVYEALLGTVTNGLLVLLRSIYDLEATKKALDLK